MSQQDTPFRPLSFKRGPDWKNRFGLAPLTNQQSHDDGVLSDEEFHWLTMRAKGGFGMTMTCASHVQKVGQGFPGQLGIWGDHQLEGLTRLASAIKAEGSVAAVQLHHAGNRSPQDLVGTPVGASDDEKTGTRGLTTEEVYQLRDDFIASAVRAEKAGFDGAEIHGAHGYILAQFLSPTINQRSDEYGGSLENRWKLIMEIIDGIRAQCRPDFQLGVRFSPERFGQRLNEMKAFFTALVETGEVDYIDLSLWDVFKEPHEEEHQGKSLLKHFMDLPRGDVRVGAAGKIMSADDVRKVIDAGCDFVLIGRAAILRHDFPKRVQADPDYISPETPVPAEHLAAEGISPDFIDYLRKTFKMVA